MNPAQLVCTDCRKHFSLEAPIWRCDCGGVLDLHHAPVFHLEDIRRQGPTMWRYRKALPLHDEQEVVSLGEAMTPLVQVNISGKNVFIKQDHLFPTGSFKDRGAAVLISHVRSLGIPDVVEDSSGNAGSSIAAYCARAGIACHILVPASTSPGKLGQIKAYGASLQRVEGTRMETASEALKAAQTGYYASHCWNPFFFHGTKTFAFEACEQLGWNAPDSVVLPVGNGTLLLGAYIGFCELMEAGVIHHLPRLVGIQAEACDPLVRAFNNGRKDGPGDLEAQRRPTVAEGIAVTQPVRMKQILKAVRHTCGVLLRVEEEEIQLAHGQMAHAGFFIEPTAATTIAGLKHYIAEHSSREERILSVFSGHGLKGSSS